MFSRFCLINAILVTSILASPVNIARRDVKSNFESACTLDPVPDGSNGEDKVMRGAVISAQCGYGNGHIIPKYKDLNECVTNLKGVLTAV